MFESRHPIKSPGTAAGVKQGRIQSASEKRTCITPDESPKRFASPVRIT
jgi:hypothetical protein